MIDKNYLTKHEAEQLEWWTTPQDKAEVGDIAIETVLELFELLTDERMVEDMEQAGEDW